MNVSSIVVKTTPEDFEKVLSNLSASDLCEVHFYDETKIIVTVEGEGIGEEMRKMKAMLNMPGVLCADLAYSYSEEAEGALEKLNLGKGIVPEALR